MMAALDRAGVDRKRPAIDTRRLFDLCVAVPILVVLSPLMLIVAVSIRATSKGPVFHRQERVGHSERRFTMLKFRTMFVDADHRYHEEMNRRELAGDSVAEGGLYKPANDPRITRIGTVLREYSIDELPQLLNVLQGDMAIIGPRPAQPWEVELFTPVQRRRHDCRPGITGLWQVCGRNRLSMRKMLALDLYYARRRSLKLDLWILLRTPYAALIQRATR